MDGAPHHDGPGEPLVEGDVLVQQGPHAARSALTAAAHEGDEITADGQEDQGRVEVDHEGGHSREGERLPRADPHVGELRVELEPEEVDAAESKIDKHPDGKEDVAWKIDPPTKSHHCRGSVLQGSSLVQVAGSNRRGGCFPLSVKGAWSVHTECEKIAEN